MARPVSIAAGIAFIGAATVAAWAGTGESYGSRDPVACPQVQGDHPTLDEAVLLFRCANEIEAGHLYLIEDVRLQIGSSRPYQFGDGYPEIDRNMPLYPIRGGWVEYQCSNIKTYPGAAPNNCTVFDKANGTGVCYRTTFGDWRCQMQGASANLRPGWVPPPK